MLALLLVARDQLAKDRNQLGGYVHQRPGGTRESCLVFSGGILVRLAVVVVDQIPDALLVHASRKFIALHPSHL